MNGKLKEEIKKNITNCLKKYCYEHNCKDIRNAIQNDICKYLTALSENSTIHSFQCICDDTDNTEAVIQSNGIKCKICLKSNENADFTVFDVTLEHQNSTFEEINE